MDMDPILSQQDLEQIWRWNSPPQEPILDCVHHIIARVAGKYPTASAISAWDGSLTYSQLDDLATKVAGRLLDSGVAPKSRIILCFEKSKWTPIAMLGAIKAGCAVIALDAAQPDARLGSILQQAKPAAIIASSGNTTRLANMTDVTILQLDQTFLRLLESSSTLPVVSPADIVYVTFTSGTTGVPKGACISHANVASAVYYQGKQLGFYPHSRVFDFVPYSFDVAWSNFLHTMCAGGCLCIGREEDMLNDLSASIAHFESTLINITPSILRTIPTVPPTLNSVLLSGEMPYPDNITGWADRVRLLNTYGPSECTFKCAFSVLSRADEGRPDIGKGVGFSTWVVDPDDSGKLVPIGSVGELYLEGPLVGQGYLFDLEKTASTFIDDPPWLTAGTPNIPGRKGKLYRTGDLVKYKEDGRLLFIGRNDTQVKIRGQRVEIGDVEYHVRRCLDREISVIADVINPRAGDSPSLALFIQVKEDEEERTKVLLDGISEKLLRLLPAFMVPGIYLPIPAIPLTANGKINRLQLREWSSTRTWKELVESQSLIILRPEHREPSNDRERDLRLIWADVLRLDANRISTMDNFLQQGGDSIAAMLVVAKVQEKNWSLTVEEIFRNPKLSAMAQVLKPYGDDGSISPFSLLNSGTNKAIVCEEVARFCMVKPDQIEDVYPCTPLQQGVLAITAKRPGDYISRISFSLPEHVDINRFKTAWERTTEHTPILSTRIVDLAGEGLVQVVVKSTIPCHSHPSVQSFLESDDQMGLGTSLCRAGIVEGSPCQFLLEMHHAIYDGWCVSLILDTVQAAYYSDEEMLQPFIQFQRFIKHISNINKQEAVSFWQGQLEGSEAAVFPPTSNVIGMKMDYQHSISDLQWPRSGITASTIVRSAIVMLLSSYTNSNDVKYGTTVNGRQAPVSGIDRIAGPTIATTPVRVQFSWDQTIMGLQEQIQSQSLEIIRYEQFGLQNIRRISHSLDEASDFQLLLVIQPHIKGTTLRKTDFFKESNPVSPQTQGLGIFNPYAIMMECQLGDSDIDLKINFDIGAFNIKQIERIALHFEHLIKQMGAEKHHHSKLRDISMLSNSDAIDIWKWNSAIPETTVVPVNEMIDQIVTLRSEALAISTWDEIFTYQHVKNWSNRLAAQLQERHVGTGDIIILCFDKSAWMIITMIAALKVGAAVLPISTTAAARSASAIVDIVHPKFAITSGSSGSPFRGFMQEVPISELLKADKAPKTSPLVQVHRILPLDPAVILFTSGSTGTPKGILWNHSTLSNNANAMRDMFGLTPNHRVMQFANYEFDVSTVESFATLITGACLCIPAESDRSNRLAGAINDSRANFLCLTPSVASTLSPGEVPYLKTLVLMGERLHGSMALAWAKSLDSVHNWYGPAECSVVTSYQVEEETWKPSIIGQSKYASTWLVDPKDANKLAPVGAIAELCVEGAILAEGYIGGGNLNETSYFFPRWLRDGYNEIPGRQSRLYKTGDLVKYDSDGNLIFLGRKEDSQRKLHGQKIDLGEIEHHIQSFLSSTIDIIVVAEIFSPAGSDRESLALFVSPRNCSSYGKGESVETFVRRVLPVEDLEDYLAQVLPQYMIPSLYIPVQDCPRTSTSKTDRRRLRQIGNLLNHEQLARMQPFRREARRPSTGMEKRLQSLWAAVIGIEQDSIFADDHFLRLGGDSISAMRLVAATRKHGLLLTVADVFNYPQLSKMAKVVKQESITEDYIAPFSLLDTRISQTDARTYAAQACHAVYDNVVDMYPCTALQEGLLAMTERNPGQYISRSVLPLQAGIDPDRLKIAWNATVEKLPVLRTRIIDIPGQGLVQVVLENLAWGNGRDVSTYMIEDECAPMALGTELCRAAIVEGNFILTIHHCIYDGHSLTGILTELESSYLERNETSPTSFQNFIRHLKQVDSQEMVEYWKAQLLSQEYRRFPTLPSSTYDPRANENLEVSVSLTWPRTGMTPSTIIRSAWTVVAARYTLSSNIIFGATVSGRQVDLKGVEDCAGPTISTVPICVSFNWQESIRKLQERIQEQAIRMTHYEHYGLRNIQRAIGDMQGSLFQTLLVVQPKSEGRVSLDEDSQLFKARTFASNINTYGTDPFNTYAMMAICGLTEAGLSIRISFDDNIIQAKQMYRICSQFENLIRQMCREDLESMSLDEIQTASDLDLEFFWNHNSTPFKDLEGLTHDLITIVAKRRPDALAVDAWDGQFTYRELDQLSNRLSYNIIDLGISLGSKVILSLEKSKWTPVAQLAVLKSGAVCMLQSTAVPEERLKRICTKLQPQLAIVSTLSRAKIVGKYVSSITVAEAMDRMTATCPIQPTLKMSDPAVILTSSGSTGEPKHIIWSQRALTANSLAWGRIGKFDASSRCFQFSSHDFDGCTDETMTTFIYGGCLCIPSEFERLNEMTASINRFGCNVALLTPSTTRLLQPDEVSCLSTLCFAGENLVQEDVDRWKDKCRLLNWYGPCEVSAAAYSAPEASTWQSGVIGRPNSSPVTRVWLVDPENPNSLVPFGAIGEIALEGPACSDGYAENEELTAKHFFDDPIFLIHGHAPQYVGRKGRIYRTGDLASYNSNGDLTFLGRKDSMFKLRGQLIAPEEVERQVRRRLVHIKEVEVVAEIVTRLVNGSNTGTLVAFISFNAPSEVIQKEVESIATTLGNELQMCLPRYAIPSFFIPISEMPRTTTGKRDRRRLREIGTLFEPPQHQHGDRRAPTTAAEKTLARLWSFVLGSNIEKVSLEDNFLHVGDSILAMRMVGMARKQGWSLTVADMFRYPRLKDMAMHIKSTQDVAENSITPFTLLNTELNIEKSREYAAKQCGVALDSIEDMFPCTPLQEGLLALTTKRKGDYVGIDTPELDPSINIARFKAAWETVVSMIPILRTRILDLPGQGLVQVVLTGVPYWTQFSNIDEFFTKQDEHPMGLDSPLMRCGIVPKGGNDGGYYFALMLHHAVYDGLTTSMVFEALERVYHGKIALPVQSFQSFAKYIASQCKESAIQFWTKQFKGLEAPQFPTLPSATFQPDADSKIAHVFEDVVWRQNGLTPTTVIRAAWATLCARYTNSSDVVFGSVVDGRKAPIPGIDQIAGPTIATLPIRVKIDGDMTVSQYLQRIQNQATEMIQYEQTGLSKIRLVSDEAEIASRFQSMLVVQPRQTGTKDCTLFLPKASVCESKAHRDQALNFSSYALTSICVLDKNRLKIEISFDSDVISYEGVQVMAQQFEQLVRQLCDERIHGFRIHELDMTTEQDLAQIWMWNFHLPQRKDRCIHDLITDISKRYPTNKAVSAWDGNMTYEILDSLSTVIARRLVAMGVSRNMIVPMCFEKSMWAPVAMLSVWKAGGAILMLDPTIPQARIGSILKQVDPKVIVSSTSNASFSSNLVTNMLVLGDNSTVRMLSNDANDCNGFGVFTPPEVKPSDLLYVIFTSGSTGTPKGCMIRHQNISAAVSLQQPVLQMDSNSRVYDFPSYMFDISHIGILHALCNGSTLCIPNEEERKSNISRSVEKFRATHIITTPVIARMLDPSVLSTLRQVHIGGEPVTNDDVDRWRPYSQVNVWNSYGPTETSGITLAWNVSCATSSSNLPIGRGLGVSTWIVDPLSTGRLAPMGAIGELYLEGPLLGEGYLADVENTAASFIEDPAWLLRGTRDGKYPGRHGRLYKTGDLVQYNPRDGTITFVGRKDTQAKLRGQRIELGDVDYHVRQCLATVTTSEIRVVSEIVVPNALARQTLAVFLQSQDTFDVKMDYIIQELEKRLPGRLPSFMVPNAYVPIHSIPLTANEKVDRKRLLEIGAELTIKQLTRKAWNSSGNEPVLESERYLQQLWATSLNIPVENVKRDTSFLQFGDSIAAMRLAAIARNKGLALTVQSILTSPRLSEMATSMASLSNDIERETVKRFSLLRHPNEKDTSLKHVAQQCHSPVSNIEDIFPCTPVQQSLFSISVKRPGDYIARLLLYLRDDVDIDRLCGAWERVSYSTAPILRSRIVDIPKEGLMQAQLHEPILWDYHASLEDYLEYDRSRPMGLADPLTRLAIAEGYCVLTQHHAIYDGHSLNLLLKDVSNAYAGLTDDSPVATFQSFIKHVVDTDKVKQEEFWRRQFVGAQSISFPALPTPDYQPRADSTVERTITNFEWPTHDVTASTVIRTAWAILSSRYTDSNDVAFGVLVTGRQAPILGIERMVAPSIAALPLRVAIDDAENVDYLLDQIQKQSIEMIGFEHSHLRDIRSINDDAERASRFNTLLVVQPAMHSGDFVQSEGPFRNESALKVASSGLDNFNPHPLMIMCSLKGSGGIHLEMNFDSNVIDVQQMERIAAQFEHVLRQVCSLEIRKVRDVETISQNDLDEIWAWNSSVPRTVRECVHDLFSSMAKKQPQAPAICAWDGNLSYDELERTSDRLAHQLTNLGAGRGSIIPLCLEKSMWMAVAALAVMKAGAACVSMDATQPEGRLQSIVSQIEPKLLLCSANKEALASRISTARPVVVDSALLHNLSVTTTQHRLPQVSPFDLLYVVFTSGSTGTPKGVVTTHENFASAALFQAEPLRVRRGTRVYDFVSYSFDVSWSNLLNTLICGACLCVPSEHERRNDIPSSLNRMNCDYVYFTPSVAQSLDPRSMPGIRTLAMGGEPIPTSEVSRWTQVESVIGIYGPAECAQALSITPLTTTSRSKHVGHSFGALTWLIEPDCPDRLAAIGTVAELMIEGPSVSQGYYQDDQKTETAYVHDPPWLNRGTLGHSGRRGKLYKTGDLLRYNSDGSLSFVGRKDGLIKLRGQRVELSEVEFHVKACLPEPELIDSLAAEVIVPRNSSNPILAVFVCFSMIRKIDAKDVHHWLSYVLRGLDAKLSYHLPQYMIPSAYIHVDKMPMTTTNKTNRRILRQIGNAKTLEDLAASEVQRERRVTGTEMEKRLQNLWASVLGVEHSSIGADSSFLRVGGESISAMRLVAAAREEGFSITVADIFKAPRLSEMALCVEPHVEKEFLQMMKPFSLLPTHDTLDFLRDFVEPFLDVDISLVKDVIPATDFQEQAIIDALQEPPSRYPHWIIDLPATTDFGRLRWACERLVHQFDILHTVFIRGGNRYWQVQLARFKPEFDLFNVHDESVSSFTNRLCAEDLQRPRMLGRAFLRFVAIKHKSGGNKLIFRISHAQFDGFSWGLVLQTLASIYSDDRQPTFPTFQQYIGFIVSKKEERMRYWDQRMQGSLYPSWCVISPEADQYTPNDRLSMARTIKMPRLDTFEHVSLATLFHAACALTFSQIFQQRELIFGRLITGRAMLPSTLQNVVGPTMTEVPIRIMINPDDTLSSIALRMQSQFIEDSTHETAGMVEIIENCTNWPKHVRHFGWRTGFQQQDGSGEFPLAGSIAKISHYERDLLPRIRPEIYATPDGHGKIVLEFEGNRKLISKSTVHNVLERVESLLREC